MYITKRNIIIYYSIIEYHSDIKNGYYFLNLLNFSVIFRVIFCIINFSCTYSY